MSTAVVAYSVRKKIQTGKIADRINTKEDRPESGGSQTARAMRQIAFPSTMVGKRTVKAKSKNPATGPAAMPALHQGQGQQQAAGHVADLRGAEVPAMERMRLGEGFNHNPHFARQHRQFFREFLLGATTVFPPQRFSGYVLGVAIYNVNDQS